MSDKIKTIKQALSPFFLRQPPGRDEIELFRKEFTSLLDRINAKESGEFHKNLIKDFLNAVYYKDKHYINTKGKNDLVIHNDKEAVSPAGVQIETKNPANKTEMITRENLNVKSFQELVLYYLRERKTGKNPELRHLVITNVYEWFVFDARNFEDTFGNDTELAKNFNEFENKTSAATKTDTFYREIAAPAISRYINKIEFTHFDVRDYEKIIRNNNKEDDRKLIALYKFLSPVHLLKLPFANDANQLNREFYAELLHIIGLEEVTQDGKKLIVRKKEGMRDIGSIVENTINAIDSLDRLNKIDAGQYGESKQERLFSVALDLSITWINRILFMKLLEAQIIRYHNGNKDFSFLSVNNLNDYSQLNRLFFSVLACKEDERMEHIKVKYAHVPYLNSSLFEKTDIEDKVVFISELQNYNGISLYPKSVLYKQQGDMFTCQNGNGMRPLDYLLRFLDAYDFSSEGSEDIQEESKTLISASVLGLIFEKINGYKDGSFFTPSFITMYICRETIGRAVIQKFNDAKGWNCKTISELYNKIEDIAEANTIFNSLRICDPAVGSGHFLVSALNEMIYLKSELGILTDENGKRLKDYRVRIENDELIITDYEDNHFTYNPKNAESQRVQETFFHEKQTIIENCIFGVDVNHNSIKICRLRLWIELLKHAFYRYGTNELETLPNIDINIKCGNSLMRRFDLRGNYAALPHATQQKLRLATQKYKEQVIIYKSTDDKTTKRQTRERIEKLKDNFLQINNPADSDYRKWKDAEDKLGETPLFFSIEEREAWALKTKELAEKVEKLREKYEHKMKTLYSNAFEWCFEFPEVLDDDGKFVGFDAVIGNPPYISAPAMVETKSTERTAIIESDHFTTLYQKWDLYIPFVELGLQLLSPNKIFSMIVPYPLTNQTYAKKLREHIINHHHLIEISDLTGVKVFDKATVNNCIPFIIKSQSGCDCTVSQINEQKQISKTFTQPYSSLVQDEKTAVWNLTRENREANRHSEMNILGDFCYISKGMVLNSDEKTAKGKFTKDDLISGTHDSTHRRKYIEAKDIERYRVKNIRYLEYGTERCPDQLSRPTFRELYEKPKLMFNRLGNLMVFYDNKTKFLHSDSMFSAVLWKDLKKIENKSIKASVTRYSRYSREEMELCSEQVDLRYLLGILNSKYASVLLTNLRGGDYHIYPEHLRNIPIPLATKEQQEPIIELVNQIISAKKKKRKNDTLALERQIDELVYGLYENFL